jgi:hypothetical protein
MMRIVRAAVVAGVLLAGCSAEPTKPEDAFGSSTAKAGAAKTSAAKPSEGPFGIDLGSDVKSVPGATAMEGQQNLFETTTPPKSHPDFESVVLVAYAEVGICTIRGIGRNLEGDAAGLNIRTKIETLTEALNTKYGNSEKTDACAGGEVTCESQFWMMTLLQGERYYGFTWKGPSEAMKQNRIREIYLAARAANINDSYPILEFHSADKAKCEQAERKAGAASL